MTLRQSSSPYGFKNLLVYKKAEEMQSACASFTSHFPRSKTLSALQDQMDRSARSVKQNIVEGWKRNSTKEYYEFLGFSLGANAELEEDCDDIIKGVYEMGGKGLKGERGFDIERVEALPFYPLNSRLPLLVQLKLRCKEMNFLLDKLQKSLLEKMEGEHRLPRADVAARIRQKEAGQDQWFERTLEEQGLVRLANGQIIKKGVKGE
jgi:four helix bundle protein